MAFTPADRARVAAKLDAMLAECHEIARLNEIGRARDLAARALVAAELEWINAERAAVMARLSRSRAGAR